ncbi:MAG: hypothetical protein U0V70_13745 [Terriglobia bacterium]
MPRSFRGLLPRYGPGLELGSRRLTDQPYLTSQGRVALEQKVLTKLEGTKKMLGSKPKFSIVMEEFGSLAEMILLLNLPDLDESAKGNMASLKAALEINSPSFRRVVYDSDELGPGLDSVKSFLEEIRSRRVLVTRRYQEFFLDQSSLDLKVPLNPLSPPFGVLSLVYVHTMNDVVRMWLWIWREANGDMADSPYLSRTIPIQSTKE